MNISNIENYLRLSPCISATDETMYMYVHVYPEYYKIRYIGINSEYNSVFLQVKKFTLRYMHQKLSDWGYLSSFASPRCKSDVGFYIFFDLQERVTLAWTVCLWDRPCTDVWGISCRKPMLPRSNNGPCRPGKCARESISVIWGRGRVGYYSLQVYFQDYDVDNFQLYMYISFEDKNSKFQIP